VPVPGYRNDIVNTLRLWSAAATDEFDLNEFNAGSYADAVASKNEAENITMVLYPNAATENGQELRLRQQYFLASASLQDALRFWNYHHDGDLTATAVLPRLGEPAGCAAFLELSPRWRSDRVRREELFPA
jgi:starch phosphorylase